MHRLCTRLSTAVLLLGLFASLVGCEFSEDPPPVRVLVPRELDVSLYTTTESGLKYYDFVVGQGARVDSTDIVKVHYAAWHANGRLIASSYVSNVPTTVPLGSDTIVEGWSRGIPGMRVGGERQLIVPPELAFGEEGYGEAGIQPNETIIYEVELLEIVEKDP